MIYFEKYYNIIGSEVEYISVSTKEGDYPYVLSVHLKSGASLSVNYKSEEICNSTRYNLILQIEQERRSDYEKLYHKIDLLCSNVKTINGRQLRIWRQLRDLLGLKVEGQL